MPPIFIIGLLLLSFSNSISIEFQGVQYKKCDCKVFANKSDCDENCYGDWCLDSNCVWDGLACQNPLCSQLTTQKSCDIFPNCFYNSQGKCEDFKSCSQITSLNSCTGQNCYLPDSESSSDYCLSSPLKPQKICSQLLTQVDCDASQEKQFDCLWWDTSCIKPTCSFFNTQIACNILDSVCLFKNNICRQITCEDFFIEDDCSSIFDLDNTIDIQCMFIQNKCINPTLQQLNTQDLCSIGTIDTYAFINGTCQQCQQWNSNPNSSTSTQNGVISGVTGTGNITVTSNATSNATSSGTEIGDQTGTQKATPTGDETGYSTNTGTQTDSSATHKHGEFIFIIYNILLLGSQ